MITSVGSRIVSAGRAPVDARLAGRGGARPRIEQRQGAEEPGPRHARSGPQGGPRGAGIGDLLCDPAALPSPARATAAARAFSAGNGFLPGLIVDRFA